MRVVNVKENGVSRGVLDKDFHPEPDLHEVTFVDYAGTPHTVFVHKDGPYADPDDAVAAFHTGELHDRPAEDDSAEPAGAQPEGHGY